MQPSTHWDRVERALAGDATERPPVSLWRHFPEDDLRPDRLAELTLAWQRKWDFDLVKLMPRGSYAAEDWGAKTEYRNSPLGGRATVATPIKSCEDWRHVGRIDPRKGAHGDQNAMLAMVASELGGRAPILQTLFSPLTNALKLAGPRLIEDLRSAPNAVEEALQAISDVTIDFALDALKSGADGFFFATQLATFDSLTGAEYERFGRAFDLRILEAVRGKVRFNILHAHGDNLMLELLHAYPVEMFNWHDRMCGPTLAVTQQTFQGVLVGGIEERGVLARGDENEVAAQMHDAVVQTGGRRLLLAPGCVLPVATPDSAISVLVDAVNGRTTLSA